MQTPVFAIVLLNLALLTCPCAGADAQFDVKNFGATGDGRTDDTAAIQRAIDAAGVTGGTLLFPPGTYVVTSVGVRPGVRYLGYGATIKRPAKQGKWIRSFDATREGYVYSSDVDSARLTIEGLTFDGNRAEQDEYLGYQLEQAHLLFLAADAKRAGRLRVRILNCHFQDAVADAISVYTNVDVQIANCSARDCFRGGITIIGGYSRIQVVNFTAEGKIHPTGIDVEVDGPGYGGSMKIELTMNGLLLPDGDFDLGVSGGSTVLGTNIMARAPFNLSAPGSTVRISNSVFGVGRFSGEGNRIVFPGNTTFQNCRFRVEPDSTHSLPAEASKSAADAVAGQWAALHVYWNISGSNETGQSLKLIDCDFEVDPGIAARDTTYAVYCEADLVEHRNRLLMDGGRISSEFDHGVFINQGGTVHLRDLEIEAQSPLYFGSAVKYPLDVLIDRVQVHGSRLYAVIPTHGPENRITHRNVEIDESANIISTQYGIANNQYLGRRTILGDTPPTETTHGLRGDVFRLKSPVPGRACEWLCTRSGCGSGAVWKLMTKLEE